MRGGIICKVNERKQIVNNNLQQQQKLYRREHDRKYYLETTSSQGNHAFVERAKLSTTVTGRMGDERTQSTDPADGYREKP